MRYKNRDEAGELLAVALASRGFNHPVVLGIPRGGVPVAAPVARALGGELGVVVARKVGAPEQPELAIGAVTADGSSYVNREIAADTGADAAYIDAAIRRQVAEARRREEIFGHRRLPSIEGRDVIVVDDGVATGATAIAAARSLRRAGARRVVLAFPVGSPRTVRTLGEEADDVVCLLENPGFRAVGEAYVDFHQVEDDEVRAILDDFEGATSPGRVRPHAPEGGLLARAIKVSAGGVVLEGDLRVPEGALGVVLFAHGSGSSRRSPRNRHVAFALNKARLATLLLDLLTEDEEAADDRTGRLCFDVKLLAGRLVVAAKALANDPATRHLAIGCFGASTGGGAALAAAARAPERIRAVVSRGGRPDLAGDALPLVRAPTLLIVGGRDAEVLALNHEALAALTCEKRLAVVPGAAHLFEEPGALDEVARLAAGWFADHLAPAPARDEG